MYFWLNFSSKNLKLFDDLKKVDDKRMLGRAARSSSDVFTNLRRIVKSAKRKENKYCGQYDEDVGRIFEPSGRHRQSANGRIRSRKEKVARAAGENDARGNRATIAKRRNYFARYIIWKLSYRSIDEKTQNIYRATKNTKLQFSKNNEKKNQKRKTLFSLLRWNDDLLFRHLRIHVNLWYLPSYELTRNVDLYKPFLKFVLMQLGRVLIRPPLTHAYANKQKWITIRSVQLSSRNKFYIRFSKISRQPFLMDLNYYRLSC